MSVLKKLTEGIVSRDLQKEGAALLNKWEATGLLEGLEGDGKRQGMARLLENQAAQLLKEASSMAAGDVEGFAAVAFPIVRRVFGGLIANDLVSVQPMSLPSGLIFFLDFQFTPGTNPRLGQNDNESVYGGGAVGLQITGGIDLGTSTPRNAELGFYALNQGYASPTGSVTNAGGPSLQGLASGTVGGGWSVGLAGNAAANSYAAGTAVATDFDAICRFDPDLLDKRVFLATITTANLTQFNKDNLVSVVVSGAAAGGSALGSLATNGGTQVRRLSQYSGSHKGETNESTIILAFVGTSSAHDTIALSASAIAVTNVSFAEADDFGGDGAAPDGDNFGMVAGTTTWGLENEAQIPEIDIKVDSVSVTAVTKKLKAKWTPELGQDLNAYHNLDAEVELTGILSEQIALEIDREILEDLIKGATASTFYWSRSPGLFVNRVTGAELGATAAAPDFTGTVSEWYETLIETINDVSAQIHRKTLRGGANFIVCSPEVANILEFTAGFRGAVTHDDDRGVVGAVKIGALSKKFDVYVDPYFPRNVVLVGRNGGSFLESGYVYAPYVPLQVTPTIFGVEDFVPRKGVMTRYAKKMVRPDMYGLVICRGLLGESGAS